VRFALFATGLLLTITGWFFEKGLSIQLLRFIYELPARVPRSASER